MPVTAKFSREFYDKLGHDVVDELVNHLNQVDTTYRSELRELNELNFARFDAKLEQRVAQLDAKIQVQFAELQNALRTALKADMDARFATTEARIARLHGDLSAARADMVKWMFVFTTSAVLAVLGLG